MTETNEIDIFDRGVLRLRRNRIAGSYPAFNFLKVEVSRRIADRLDDFARDFPRAADIGCHGGELGQALAERDDVEFVIETDLSGGFNRGTKTSRIVTDEEFLPFKAESLDLAASALSLHWTNDLPGALLQIRRSLRGDGLFLGAVFGGETLKELRQSFLQAEIEETGGVSPRVSPFIDVRDAGNLLQRAGFALPVTDVETITVDYPDAFALMRDLRGMGETNALRARRKTFTGRATLLSAADHYQRSFASEDGRIQATFQIVFMTGWAPHESQQKPLRPGSARSRLADALGTVELPAGDKTFPNEPDQ